MASSPSTIYYTGHSIIIIIVINSQVTTTTFVCVSWKEECTTARFLNYYLSTPVHFGLVEQQQRPAMMLWFGVHFGGSIKDYKNFSGGWI